MKKTPDQLLSEMTPAITQIRRMSAQNLNRIILDTLAEAPPAKDTQAETNWAALLDEAAERAAEKEVESKQRGKTKI